MCHVSDIDELLAKYEEPREIPVIELTDAEVLVNLDLIEQF